MKVSRLISYKGSITVFVSIVLTSIFLVVGTFTDAARIKLAHSQVQRANQTALSSVLACYNNELKDEYGLFGFCQDNDTITDCYEEYFSKNLNIGSQDFLYGYNIENIKLEQLFNLENTEVFEEQTMEFMKYRAPAEMASVLLSKTEVIKNISKGSKLYKRKMETDKKAGVIGELQMFLEDKTNKINSFGIASKLSDLKSKIIDNNMLQESLSEQLSNLQSLYSGEGDRAAKKDLLKEIDSIQQQLRELVREKAELKNTILNNINQFKTFNTDAKEHANNITIKKDELLNRIEEELKFADSNQEGIEEIQKNYKETLFGMKKLVGEDNSYSVTENYETNINYCVNIINKANSSEDDFLSALDDLCVPKEINYTFNKCSQASSEDEDNRGKVNQVIKKAFNQKGEMKCIDSDLLKQLPSRKRKLPEENSDWDTKDFDTSNGAEKELQYIAEKENRLSQIALSVAEELYLNEYIMGLFRHDVPLLKGEKDSAAYNLRSEDKYKRNGFFSCYEVEYIINGNKDEAVNSLLIKSEILALRLAANVIHIYSDPSKMSRVTCLAAALSSWNAGLSAPIIETMLIFSWAMFESLYDLEQLSLGEKIALYKTKDQWKTDISGTVNNKNITNADKNPFLLSYQDYLRIFLLLTDKEKKLARTQDIIQLNVGLSCEGFTLENAYVALAADTTVSIKNLFVSFPVFTPDARRNISRTSINERMLISY